MRRRTEPTTPEPRDPLAAAVKGLGPPEPEEPEPEPEPIEEDEEQ